MLAENANSVLERLRVMMVSSVYEVDLCELPARVDRRVVEVIPETKLQISSTIGDNMQ